MVKYAKICLHNPIVIIDVMSSHLSAEPYNSNNAFYFHEIIVHCFVPYRSFYGILYTVGFLLIIFAILYFAIALVYANFCVTTKNAEGRDMLDSTFQNLIRLLPKEEFPQELVSIRPATIFLDNCNHENLYDAVDPNLWVKMIEVLKVTLVFYRPF